MSTLSAVKKNNVVAVKTKDVNTDSAQIKKLTTAIEAQAAALKEEVSIRKNLENKLAEFEDRFDTESRIFNYNLRREYIGELNRLRSASQSVVNELTAIINKASVAETLQAAVLHKKAANPKYTYRTVTFADKISSNVLTPPPGLGWELNRHKGSMGQESLGEEHFVYWMRLKNIKK